MINNYTDIITNIKLKLHILTSISYITFSHILSVYIIILHILSNILHILFSQIQYSYTLTLSVNIEHIFKTWSHPLSQSKPSILMLYIPLNVLIHQVMVASCAVFVSHFVEISDFKRSKCSSLAKTFWKHYGKSELSPFERSIGEAFIN